MSLCSSESDSLVLSFPFQCFDHISVVPSPRGHSPIFIKSYVNLSSALLFLTKLDGLLLEEAINLLVSIKC